MKKEYKCESCGTKVYRYDCQMTKSKHVYCSLACVGKSKQNGSTVECAYCKKSFYRRFGEQDLNVRINQYCSLDCYTIDRDNGKSYKKIKDRHAHRIIAEQAIGRDLKKGEVVHHKDGNKRNNDPSNLVVLPSQSVHAKIHAAEKKKNTR